MTEIDTDLLLLDLLWFIKGGELTIRRNGVDSISIRSNGIEPELDIRNIDSLKDLIPPVNLFLLSRLNKLSKKVSAKGRNLRIDVNGIFLLNLGAKGGSLNEVEKITGKILKKTKQILKSRS